MYLQFKSEKRHEKLISKLTATVLFSTLSSNKKTSYITHPPTRDWTTDVRLVSKVFVGDVVLRANEHTTGSIRTTRHYKTGFKIRLTQKLNNKNRIVFCCIKIRNHKTLFTKQSEKRHDNHNFCCSTRTSF